MLMYNQPSHNISHHTQPLMMPLPGSNDQDKVTLRYANIPQSTQDLRKSNDQHSPNVIGGVGTNSSSAQNTQAPILNINTASDINIYNNSFIVNTNPQGQPLRNTSFTKKLPLSQNQSRSSSLKRNTSGGTNSNTQVSTNGYIANSMRQQMINGKLYNVNSAGGALNQVPQNASALAISNTGQGGISMQNLFGINQEYQTQLQLQKNQQQQRSNSQHRLSATSANDKQQKYNLIKDAYTTTTNFFQSGDPSHHSHSYQLPSSQHIRQTSSQKKRVKLTNRSQANKHQKQTSSTSNFNQLSRQYQQNYTQSFDQLQPFNSSEELNTQYMGASFGTSASKNKKKWMSGDNSAEELQSYSHVMKSSSPNLNSQNRQNKNRVKSMNLMIQGKKKIMEKDYQSAIAMFNEAIRLDSFNEEAQFYRALSKLDCGQNNEAIEELKNIISGNQSGHSPICHILLSIALKRMNEATQSIDILDQCIQSYPAYADAYIARGQALLIQENYTQALKDFSQYTQLLPQNGMGFIGVGDSHKALKQWQQSITAYSKAIQLYQSNKIGQFDEKQRKSCVIQAILKRGLAYYHLQMYQQATVDFQAVLKSEVSSIKAHFYIGKILSKQYLGEMVLPKDIRPPTSKQRQKIQNEAILHFEQVVKYHNVNGEVYAGNALFEIAKLRLHDKDFYEAYFNLKRAVDSNFNSKRLQLYKDFTEGVLYLIKRKIKKGVQILSDLLEILVNTKNKKDKAQLDYLKHQSYIYRAYGYVAIEKYEVALQDIKKAKKIAKLDASSVYNKLLGKGILRMDHEDYLMATKYFNKASLKFPSNKDSYCLYIISIVRSYTYSHFGKTIDQEEKREKVIQAKEFMDRAITNCNVKVKVPSLYFFRGLLFFQLHMFYQALQDFNVAIEEEEEPTASYYLARGRTYACLSILNEAMKDLSIALNLDETLQEAYIYRGKCAYLLGDNNLAFLDFQRLILTDPKNPLVHVYAGNLLMTTGAYQDAIKAFLNADTVEKTGVAAFQRARCYCALTDLENAKMQFKIALQHCKNEELITIDSQILTALMRVINATSPMCTEENAKNQIAQSTEIICQLIDLFESEKIKEFKKKDGTLNIQIIPNVRRIKIEKLAVGRELYAQQQSQDGQKTGTQISIATEELASQSLVDLEQIKDLQPYSYYYENVFSIEDLYLFRAVFKFYSKDYQSAINDYETCQHLKMDEKKFGNTKSIGPHPGSNYDHLTESYKAYSHSSTPMLSMNSSKTDLSDVGLCSLNVHETNYNIFLCYLLMKNYQKSLEKINEIIGQAPGKYQRHFFILRAMIYQQLGQNEKAQKDLAKYEKYEPKNYEQFVNDGKDLVFEPFPIKNRLCSRFEYIKFSFISSNQNKSPKICLKPSFSMPFIKPPNMIPNIDEESIQNEFTLKQIDAPMPEAPWIRRWGKDSQPDNSEGGCIKFTDNILLHDEDDDQQMNDIQNSSSDQSPLKQQQKSNKSNLIADNKSQKQQAMVVQDESPYLQSIEVNPTQNQSRNRSQGISEQIIKQTNGKQGGNSTCEVNAMMAYQFLGDVMDVDQISDKHRISLFDDSRYEDLGTLDGSVKGRSLLPEEYKNNTKPRILINKEGDCLTGGDSLYEEQLLDDERVQIGVRNEEEEEDDDDSSNYSDDQLNYNQEESKSQVGVSNAFVAESMVLMGENVSVTRKQRVKKQKPTQLILSQDTDEKQRHRMISELELRENTHTNNDDEENRESIFRSRQSSKR